MKKILVLLLISVLLAAALSTGFIAYAGVPEETVLPIEAPAEEPVPVEIVGTELAEGYSASIGFSYLQPAEGGVYLRYELFFDDGFVTEDNSEQIAAAVEAVKEMFANTVYRATVTSAGISAQASFESLTDYYIAAGASGNDKPGKDTAVYHYHWFFVDVENQIDNPLKDSSVVTSIEEKISALNAEKVQYVYTYSTRYKTVDSDASIVENDGTYMHTFYMDKETMPETLTLRQHAVNASGWYIIALVFAFAVGIVITVVGMKKFAAKDEGKKE